MAVNPHQDIQTNPKLHMGLNPFILTMSEELFALNQMNTMVRIKRFLIGVGGGISKFVRRKGR